MGKQRHWSLSPRFCIIVTTHTTPLGMPGHPPLHQSLSCLPSGFSTIATCPRKPLVTSFAFLPCSEQLKHIFTGSLTTPPNTPLITDRCLVPAQTQADPTLDTREGEGNYCHCPRGDGGAGWEMHLSPLPNPEVLKESFSLTHSPTTYFIYLFDLIF